MIATIRRRALRYARAAGLPGTLNPRDVFQDGSLRDRQAFYDAALARNRQGYEARVAFMEQLNRDAATAPAGNGATVGLRLPDIPRDQGWLLYRPDNLPVLNEAIAEARELFRGYVPGSAPSKRERDPLQGVPRPNRSYDTAINRLATHPEVLRVVSNYLGMLPILQRINILYSPNDEVIEASSQFFHLDPEDVIMMKIFIFVEDVDVETGPTTVLPADRSAAVRQAITYRKGRVADEVIARLGGKEHLVECTGPAGTLAFLDTCRCFHMGSRKASKPRYAIMVQYVTPYAATFDLDGPLPTPAIGVKAIPPEPSLLEEYLFGLRR
jgi:hypothetical protein